MPTKIRVNPERLSAASRRSYGVPVFWVDRPLKCRACGAAFTFTAEQQRERYEIKGRHICEQPVLCSNCHIAHNQRRRLKARMDFARRALDASPNERTKLEAAVTTIEYFQSEKRGDIQFALHLLRELLCSRPADPQLQELCDLAKNLQPT